MALAPRRLFAQAHGRAMEKVMKLKSLFATLGVLGAFLPGIAAAQSRPGNQSLGEDATPTITKIEYSVQDYPNAAWNTRTREGALTVNAPVTTIELSQGTVVTVYDVSNRNA